MSAKQRVAVLRDGATELRAALTRAARHPAFSVGVVVMLAVGVGGATAAFSLENAVDLRAFPYAKWDRLVAVQLYRLPHGFCAGGCLAPRPCLPSRGCCEA